MSHERTCAHLFSRRHRVPLASTLVSAGNHPPPRPRALFFQRPSIFLQVKEIWSLGIRGGGTTLALGLSHALLNSLTSCSQWWVWGTGERENVTQVWPMKCRGKLSLERLFFPNRKVKPPRDSPSSSFLPRNQRDGWDCVLISWLWRKGEGDCRVSGQVGAVEPWTHCAHWTSCINPFLGCRDLAGACSWPAAAKETVSHPLGEQETGNGIKGDVTLWVSKTLSLGGGGRNWEIGVDRYILLIYWYYVQNR